MKLKRLVAVTVALAMIMALVPAGTVSVSAEGERSVTDKLGGAVLWECPDGSFDDTPVSTAFEGWDSSITSGYVNLKTYTVGNTLQYYVNGTDNVTRVTSPGYGEDAEKIIIEWVMKRQNPADLYFDFSFRDIDDTEIAYLKLDKNAVDVGYSHPNSDTDFYAMGYPQEGTACAIVAYNNADGETHTTQYYVAGEIVSEETQLQGTIRGFKSIVSSNGKWSTKWNHIGFANLTIGAVLPDIYKTVVVDYTANGTKVSSVEKYYDSTSEEGAAFDAYTYSENGTSEWYYANSAFYSANTTVEMQKLDNWGEFEKGYSFMYDDTGYATVSGNLIPNASFAIVENGEMLSASRAGWYNCLGEEAEFFQTYVLGYMYVSKGGTDRYGANSLYRAWPTKKGKKYLFTYGTTDANQYFVASGKDSLGDVEDGDVILGGSVSGENTVVFEAKHDYLQINFRWIKDETFFYNFGLYEVDEAGYKCTTTIRFIDSYTGNAVCEPLTVESYAGAAITIADYAPTEIEGYNGNIYTRDDANIETYTVEADGSIEITYTTEGIVEVEQASYNSISYNVLPNIPIMPKSINAVKGTGEAVELEVESWSVPTVAGLTVAAGTVEGTDIEATHYVINYSNSFSLNDMNSVSGQTEADNSLNKFPVGLRDSFLIDMAVSFESFGDTWIVLKNSENKRFFGPDQVLVGVDSSGGLKFVDGNGEGGRNTSDATIATLEKNTVYRILVAVDPSNNTYSAVFTNSDGEVILKYSLGFRTNDDVIDSVAAFTNSSTGKFTLTDIMVHSDAMESGVKEYTIVTVKDGNTVTEVGEYYNENYITAPEIEGYTLTKTVEGYTVTFTYVKDAVIGVSFVNESGEVVLSQTTEGESLTVPAQEIFAITESGGAFYQIPETVVDEADMVVKVYKAENKYAVIEDAYVDYNNVYGIGTTQANGVMIASGSDSNRGPESDANGETTYLEGASPTTLGRSRVGVMKFPVVELEEGERATMKLYARSWHQQGFDGGNTYLKIEATPISDNGWAESYDEYYYYIAGATPVSYWETPIFSEKAYQSEDYVNFDVTDVMKAAAAAGESEISFKFRIYFGAAYVAERESAVLGGSYEGKAAYIEVTDDSERMFEVTAPSSATLTKNGSVMQGKAYCTADDDVRLLSDSDAIVLAAEGGYYMMNENLRLTEKTDFSEASLMALGIAMVDGAQVRTGGGVDENGKVDPVKDSGIRFVATANYTDTVLNDSEFGIKVTAEGSENAAYVKAEKFQNDANDVFSAAITNLEEKNYNRNYTACGYARVKLANGEIREFNTDESITRSIYKVAAGHLVNNTETDAVNTQLLYSVLNAYVNQVGIRLTFAANEEQTQYELTARTGGNGAYTGDVFFEVGETSVDGREYTVKLTPVGTNTRIVESYWNEYVRINNNNSQIKAYTTLTDNNDGTYSLSFDTTNLNIGATPEERFEAMKPTYNRAVAAMESVNTYWQTNQSYIDWYGSTHPAFWDKAAYHTGNIEMYKLTGDESYLQYSIDWANYNEWMGNNSTSSPDTWTWGYNQTQGSNAVLFGDWQICFQTYIDLYAMGVEDANLDRVYEVIDYQISKDEDGFWWWADALYMVMPVFTKLYKETGDEKYLDALYKYFKYAKELMYDGEGGIPTDETGYTTSAALNSGAYYSNVDDYKNLFYRDAGYVYPLNPNSGHETEKNFWARGNGWVFAGLSKVLSDMPEDYEHYDEFYNTYVEMAEAIISCQQLDDNGYGFWTQSMLQDYPKGSNGNDYGYETSGTAFFTYGLFWGINNGILDEETYLSPAVRAWGYLENEALHDSGKVGYVQPIGSNATQAVSYDTTANFGVGAYLLAAAEAARWAQAQ